MDGSLVPVVARNAPPTIFPTNRPSVVTPSLGKSTLGNRSSPAFTATLSAGTALPTGFGGGSPPAQNATVAKASLDTYFPEPLLASNAVQETGHTFDPLRDVKPSQGAGVQLEAAGPQDRFLFVNPERTFFKAVNRRHTPFAIQTHEDYFYGDFRLGATNIAPISLLGDLLNDAWLQVTLPALGNAGNARWVPWVGYAMIKSVSLRIGTNVVETLTRDWMYIRHVLDTPSSKVDGYDATVGKDPLDASETHVLFVPLPFFFCRRGSERDRQPLPLVNMTNTTLRVVVEAEEWRNLLTVDGDAELPAATDVTVSLLYDYVLLEEEELSAFKLKHQTIMHDTAVELDAPAFTVASGASTPLVNVPVRLRSINLPVTALYFVLQDEDAARAKTLFRYVQPRQAVLYLSSQKRFEERPGAYFSVANQYSFGRRCNSVGVGLYSFRLEAVGPPSGHVCMSAFDEPTLVLSPPPGQGDGLKVTVIARTVNWLTLAQGVASLRFV